MFSAVYLGEPLIVGLLKFLKYTIKGFPHEVHSQYIEKELLKECCLAERYIGDILELQIGQQDISSKYTWADKLDGWINFNIVYSPHFRGNYTKFNKKCK